MGITHYNKFKNKKVLLDGYTFDSKKEARRYVKLKELQGRGEISDLELQTRFTLQDKYVKNGKKIKAIEYVADFVYKDSEGNQIVEDCKGFRTPIYKLKKKIFEYRYPHTIKES